MTTRTLVHAALLAALAPVAISAQAAEPARHLTDIPDANVVGQALALDQHLPAGATNPPLVVYVHGGAWRSKAQSGNTRAIPPRCKPS